MTRGCRLERADITMDTTSVDQMTELCSVSRPSDRSRVSVEVIVPSDLQHFPESACDDATLACNGVVLD